MKPKFDNMFFSNIRNNTFIKIRDCCEKQDFIDNTPYNMGIFVGQIYSGYLPLEIKLILRHIYENKKMK